MMARRIPRDKVEEIYAAADIVDIVGDYLQLKKRGSNYFALSPFANEKTPSFAVSPSKNIFKDFSSGKGGNAVTFLMEVEGMSYVEALTHIAEKYGIELQLEEVSDSEKARDDKKQSLIILNEFAAKYFHEQLIESEDGKRLALSYFKERGILDATIEKFQLGYSPDEWEAFTSHALKHQFKGEFLEETGLSFRSEKQNKLLDRFKGRIMFPIHDHLGKVIAFGGRILKKDKKAAKYVNSKESDLYHKSKVLYGLNYAKQKIRDQDLCILVEGYMDVIALSQHGVENAVASSGTALTEEQARLVKRFTKNILLIYDADQAGINAALRGLDILIEQGLSVKILLLPEGHDPDSYINEFGHSGFTKYQEENSQDVLQFKISQLLKGKSLSDLTVKTDLIHQVAKTLAKIPDKVTQGVYLQFAAQQLDTTEDLIHEALRNASAQKTRQERRQKVSKETREALTEKKHDKFLYRKTVYQEVELLRLLLNYGGEELTITDEEGKTYTFLVASFFEKALRRYSFVDPVMEQLKIELLDSWISKAFNLHFFINHENEEVGKVVGFLVSLVKFSEHVSPNWAKFEIHAPSLDDELFVIVQDGLMHYQRKKVKKLIEENQEKIRKLEEQGQGDSSEMLTLLQTHKKLNDEMKVKLLKKIGTVIEDWNER